MTDRAPTATSAVPSRQDRIDAFLAEFAKIHEIPGFYAADAENPDRWAAHRKAADELFEQSRGFFERIPWDEIETVIDVGLGYGSHCAEFAARGKAVTGVSVHLSEDLRDHARINGYQLAEMDMHFLEVPENTFDLVWSSHTLEHAFSPMLALTEWRRVLKPGGYLAITVPPFKTRVVSGHFTTGWTVGQLLYMLVVTGWQIEDGFFERHKYNVRAIVRKPPEPIDPTGASRIDLVKDRLPQPLRDLLNEQATSVGGLNFEGDLARLDSDQAISRTT